MPIRIEDRCPSCESWLGDLDEQLGEEVWRSKKGFQCPNCNNHLVVKRYLLWLNPLLGCVAIGSLILKEVCEKPLQLYCTPIQESLGITFKISFIMFLVTLCIQNLKLKNT